MVLGLSLKKNSFESARDFHRIASLITLVTTLITMIVIVSQKTSRIVTTLAIVAFGATLMASVGGNLTRTSKQELGYFLMVASFAVAFICTIAAVVLWRRKAAVESDTES